MIEEQTLARIQAADILAHYRELVWPIVQSYLVGPPYPRAFEGPAAYKREQDLHWGMIREYPKRQGKYLRPAFLLLTCEAMGGDAMLARNTAAAMQLSEEWILIHDDIEDNSLARRGAPTLHRMIGAMTCSPERSTMDARTIGVRREVLNNKAEACISSLTRAAIIPPLLGAAQ